MIPAPSSARGLGKWWVCGLLLWAMTLNYMDRQTLALTIVPIQKELGLSNEQYGLLEKGFAYAFAFGGLLAGWLADRVGIRWLYPLALLAWSGAGIASGYADRIGQLLAGPVHAWRPDWVDPNDPTSCAFVGFLACRTALGLFESGQWPCALIVTQRLLTPVDRPLGNSLLQAGASLGAILTPLVVQAMLTDAPGSWRGPYVAVGIAGVFWILAWTPLTAGVRLDTPAPPIQADALAAAPAAAPAAALAAVPVRARAPATSRALLARRILAMAIMVIAINLPWHFFRAWLPKMLEEFHGYQAAAVRYFTSAYYVMTDAGCIAAGFAVRLLTMRRNGLGTGPFFGRRTSSSPEDAARKMDLSPSAPRMRVHTARMAVYFVCASLTALSTVAAGLGRGPLLLGLLLVIGFGSLGCFPNYYSLTQELSFKHQGKLTGLLSCCTWVATAEMQHLVGRHVDRSGSYSQGIFWLGLAPIAAFFAVWALWGRAEEQ